MDYKFLCETLFDKIYPELEIKIKSVEVLERKKLSEDNNWVDDSPSIFVGIELKEFPSKSSNISEELTNLTGFEFNVYRI